MPDDNVCDILPGTQFGNGGYSLKTLPVDDLWCVAKCLQLRFRCLVWGSPKLVSMPPQRFSNPPARRYGFLVRQTVRLWFIASLIWLSTCVMSFHHAWTFTDCGGDSYLSRTTDSSRNNKLVFRLSWSAILIGAKNGAGHEFCVKFGGLVCTLTTHSNTLVLVHIGAAFTNT